MSYSFSFNVKRLILTIAISAGVALGIIHLFENNFFFNVFNEQGELLVKQSAAPFMIIGAIFGLLAPKLSNTLVDIVMHLTRSKAEKEASKTEKGKVDE